ncbi:Receptor L-domain domain-containing protein [Caenorhabditis elegans]|uniref:Receptor L-domain domain-containing protein n=1 Tax=Caenorhabditis elegans TaxID=6239 RepID=Q9N4N6_CAEEL|nr:Receptor L-domain domain-containing protein [Caenorhabditis elegans]CCD73708.1 Receptor L-domain domain-containing protein [Caenorhabditis elegans]|eukprot:NP_494405.1 Insulin/EGF-Receptor L Domain protein [Caenorhabditis elegans]
MRFLSCLVSLVLADFNSNLEKLSLTHKCDPLCTFNHSEVTSSTAQYFPTTCDTVCGILTFNSDTDLSHSELVTLFKNMRTFSGGITFENTGFQNLSIFWVHDVDSITFNCKTFGMSVLNNSELTSVRIIDYFLLETDRLSKECAFRVENNEKLNASSVCQSWFLQGMYSLKVSGNRRDCGCRGDKIALDTMPEFQNCTTVTGLNLTNISTTDLPSFANVREIRSYIDIQQMHLQNLSFLKKLRVVRAKNFMYENVIVNVRNNPEMTRLAVPSLNNFAIDGFGPVIMNLENLHPDFCLTFGELKLFMEELVYFTNIQAKYCGIDTFFEENEFCEFLNMSSLEPFCLFIYGKVVLEAGDEEFVWKLKKMTHLFGSLVVRNTQLEDLGFLGKLKFIGNLDSDALTVQIVGNHRLTFAYIPWLENIITSGNRIIIVDNNSLLKTEKFSLFAANFQTKLIFKGDAFGKIS